MHTTGLERELATRINEAYRKDRWADAIQLGEIHLGPFGRAMQTSQTVLGADTNGVSQVSEGNIVRYAQEFWGIELTRIEAKNMSINNDDLATAMAAAHISAIYAEINEPTAANLFTAYALSEEGITRLNSNGWNYDAPGVTDATRTRRFELYNAALRGIN